MPDYIIFKGDTIATYNLILEQYLQWHEKTESEKLFGLSFRNSFNGEISFNCWRGYQAIYKIDDDSLFLVDIISCGERRNGKIDKTASIEKIKNAFGDKVVHGRVYILRRRTPSVSTRYYSSQHLKSQYFSSQQRHLDLYSWQGSCVLRSHNLFFNETYYNCRSTTYGGICY